MEEKDPWKEICVKAIKDTAFKKKLMDDPRKVLKENGIDIPEGVDINIVQNSKDKVNLILPMAMERGELTDEELDAVAGGGLCCISFLTGSWNCWSTFTQSCC